MRVLLFPLLVSPTLFSITTFILLVLLTTFAPSPSSAAPISSELAPLLRRRIEIILASPLLEPQSLPQWLSTLGSNGKWPDSEIDYTTGCDAQRANWPAYDHWKRIDTMAAAWRGLPGQTKYRNNPQLLASISSALNWWFQRDFTNAACIDSGDTSSCPCGTAGLWNSNWFSNVILVPNSAVADCLLLSDVLTSSQRSACSKMALRTYGTFKSGKGYVSGANILNIASISVDGGLFNNNASIITDAYNRVHSQMVIQSSSSVDGIFQDGSFGQHLGLLYNGNYGKDFINAVMSLETVAAGSKFAVASAAKSAFTTLMDGSRWMIVMNSATKVAHWDLNALSRFISFPVIDSMATGSLNMNLTRLNFLANTWKSDTLKSVYTQLTKTASNANIGPLYGIRNFYKNDYFVRRGKNYVTTIKGYSTRTLNSECTNSQNPLGFHLSDGLTYQYVSGSEYEDIAAAWDWNLLPGTTVNYGATPLNCETVKFKGKESFVGGANAGDLGVFAMRYTNPYATSFGWRKSTFFFKNDTQHVVISNIKTTGSAPIYSVLDQRKRSGNPQVDFKTVGSGNLTTFSSLWHGNTGYYFDSGTSTAARLTLSMGTKTGKWSTIGTSKQPPTSANLFAAWLHHMNTSSPVSYTIYPGVTLSEFKGKTPSRLQNLQRDDVHAVFDTGAMDFSGVFWVANKTVEVPNICKRRFNINSNQPIVALLQRNWKLTVSDPTQKLTQVTIKISLLSGSNLSGWGSNRTKTFTVKLPQGSTAGSAVTTTVSSSTC